jgi:hypothetical protein
VPAACRVSANKGLISEEFDAPKLKVYCTIAGCSFRLMAEKYNLKFRLRIKSLLCGGFTKWL